MRFGSLCAGIDGLGLGFERAGMTCVWQVEINKFAQRVLRKNWPASRLYDDVRSFPPDDGFNYLVDLIGFGFPCQDISLIGEGGGLDGDESRLFFDCMRVVRILRPRFVVIENVPALITRGLDRVLCEIAKIGMDAEWSVVSSCSFGAPHPRERLLIVAYSQSKSGIHEPLIWKGSSRLSDDEIAGFTSAWDEAYPRVCRVDDGIPNRVDRSERLGNAIDPRWAEFVGRKIMECEAKISPTGRKE